MTRTWYRVTIVWDFNILNLTAFNTLTTIVDTLHSRSCTMNLFELLSNRLCKFIIYDQLFSIMPVNSDDVFKYQSTPSPIFKVHLIKKLHAGLYMLLKLNIKLKLKKSEAIYYCSSCSHIYNSGQIGYSLGRSGWRSPPPPAPGAVGSPSPSWCPAEHPPGPARSQTGPAPQGWGAGKTSRSFHPENRDITNYKQQN